MGLRLLLLLRLAIDSHFWEEKMICENILCFRIYLYLAQTCFHLSFFSFLTPVAKKLETEERSGRWRWKKGRAVR